MLLALDGCRWPLQATGSSDAGPVEGLPHLGHAVHAISYGSAATYMPSGPPNPLQHMQAMHSRARPPSLPI